MDVDNFEEAVDAAVLKAIRTPHLCTANDVLRLAGLLQRATQAPPSAPTRIRHIPITEIQ